MCGLKLAHFGIKPKVDSVTPFVGVWIETLSGMYKSETSLVTPFVGVWIETFEANSISNSPNVTPFVGVWIETIGMQTQYRCELSHPSWVCGLKLLRLMICVQQVSSHTLRGCVD